MKASKFIKKLQNSIINYGDLEVMCMSFDISDKAGIGINSNKDCFVIMPECMIN